MTGTGTRLVHYGIVVNPCRDQSEPLVGDPYMEEATAGTGGAEDARGTKRGKDQGWAGGGASLTLAVESTRFQILIVKRI